MRKFTITLAPHGAGRTYTATLSAPAFYAVLSLVAATILLLSCLLVLSLVNAEGSGDLRSLQAENADLKKELDRVPALEAEVEGLREMAGQVAAMLGLEPGIARAAGVDEDDSTGPHGDWCWPVIGRVSKRFEESGEDPHLGMDIAAEEGSLVRSAAAGVVVECGFREDLGNFVVIDHGAVTSLYGHSKQVLVSNGQRVSSGEPVATIGQTGRASGPHLHLEVIEDGMPRDPLDFLPR